MLPLSGCSFYSSYFINLLTSNLPSRYFEEKLTQIDDYMRNGRLAAAMREKVTDCFYLQYSNNKLYDECQILDMLTPEIKLFNMRDIVV